MSVLARPAPLFADIDDVAKRLSETGYLSSLALERSAMEPAVQQLLRYSDHPADLAPREPGGATGPYGVLVPGAGTVEIVAGLQVSISSGWYAHQAWRSSATTAPPPFAGRHQLN